LIGYASDSSSINMSSLIKNAAPFSLSLQL
jgi:hypothetical protein